MHLHFLAAGWNLCLEILLWMEYFEKQEGFRTNGPSLFKQHVIERLQSQVQPERNAGDVLFNAAWCNDNTSWDSYATTPNSSRNNIQLYMTDCFEFSRTEKGFESKWFRKSEVLSTIQTGIQWYLKKYVVKYLSFCGCFSFGLMNCSAKYFQWQEKQQKQFCPPPCTQNKYWFHRGLFNCRRPVFCSGLQSLTILDITSRGSPSQRCLQERKRCRLFMMWE